MMLWILALLAGFTPAQAKTLEIAVEDSAEPWSMPDGRGYANDIVKAAFAAAGVHVKLKVVPYARCKYLAIEGLSLACFSMSPEPGHEDTLVLSESPLFVLKSDYFQNLKMPLPASNEAAIPKGTIIGTVIGYEYPPSVDVLKKRGVIFDEAKTEEANLEKLALGRLNGAIINHNEIKDAKTMIQKAGAEGKVGFAFRCGDLNTYIGFSKKNPNGLWAKTKFDHGFKIIRENGSIQKITEKWARASRR